MTRQNKPADVLGIRSQLLHKIQPRQMRQIPRRNRFRKEIHRRWPRQDTTSQPSTGNRIGHLALLIAVSPPQE